MIRATPVRRALWVLLFCVSLCVMPVAAEASGAGPRPDFNADGYADLPVGALADDVGTHEDAGSVTVLYGGPSGPSAVGSQLWTLDTPRIPGAAATGGYFGWELAWGDFDGDGFDDLAVTSMATVSGVSDAGSVTVLYGSITGLSATGADVFTRATAGVPGNPGAYERFGDVLAGGDLDGDGIDDLVVGIPSAQPNWSGAIVVLFGSTGGVATAGAEEWTTASPGIAGSEHGGARLGESLTTGDFNGDGYDDVAAGSDSADESGLNNSGAVWTFYGTAAGLTATGSQLLTEATPGVVGEPGQGEGLGGDVGSGDFNGDGFDELAVLIRDDDVNGIEGAGSVLVLGGSPAGLDPYASSPWHQDRLYVPGTAEVDDIPYAIAVGDFDGDGRDDLAIGYPGEDVDGKSRAGVVIVIYGTPLGLGGSGSQIWSQDSLDVPGSSEASDWFGMHLMSLDADGNASDDLAVAAPQEDHAAVDDGVVNVLLGTSSGLTDAGSQIWSHHSSGVYGTADGGDEFGAWMAGR